MGIRGLATFIGRYSDKYLEDYELRDCHLVIDGNSFACQLYASSSKFNSAFGGDYDHFAASVIEFFSILRKCQVVPVVIFDGGYEKHKLKTTFIRIKQKWAVAREMTPMSQHKNSIFPCFLKEVVKGVLRELHIPFAQCLFEADVEIAAVARHLKCPVLSYDSDFFVYDVLYIPFPTLHLYPCKDMSAESTEGTYYLSCSLYRVENFLKRYGGLQKEILPFLSIMLGCDYIGTRVYKYFVSHLKQKTCGGSNLRQRRIASLLEWLRTETLESAKLKVVGCLRKHKRKYLLDQIKRIISMYVGGSSELLPFLGFEVSNDQVEPCGEEKNMKQILGEQHDLSGCWQEIGGNSNSEESDEENDATGSNNDSLNESEEVQELNDEEENEKSQFEDIDKQSEDTFTTLEVKKASHLPVWFLQRFRQGDLPSAFMDMIIFNTYFIPPQVEDYSYPTSHIISMPLIAVLYGLMVGCKFGNLLRCQIRAHRSPSHYVDLAPTIESASVKFPSLEDLPKLSMPQRLLILVEVAGLNTSDQKQMASLPLSWQLYMISLVFWARETDQPVVNSSHIDALLLCLMLLDVMGKNAVCSSTTKQVSKGMKNKSRKQKPSGSDDNMLFALALSVGNKASTEISSKTNLSESIRDTLVTEKTVSEVKSENEQDCMTLAKENVHVIEELNSNRLVKSLECVNSQECGIAKKILRPMCLMEEKMKTRPKLFNISTVHSFAQFQSCLLHFTYLNALLGYPLPHCNSFRVFSGTFVYNMYNNLKQRTNALEYISQLLSKAPSVVVLFKVLREDMENLIPKVPSSNRVKRKHHGKKKCRSAAKTGDTSVDVANQSADTDFEDSCNRFAALAVKH